MYCARLPLLILSLAPLFSQTSEQLPSAAAILDRYVAVTGGQGQ
jgi:hypothetical protein